MKKLNFKPLFGLSSRHLQLILSSYTSAGAPPPSQQMLVDLDNEDKMSCEVSLPPKWEMNGQTVVLIHGLGGSHASGYMIRMARKLYEKGKKVVRINLRGCGSGKGLSKLPYGAGNSKDVLKVLQQLKEEAPNSEIILIGFSLGGNTVLKLAGEMGEEAKTMLQRVIAVCPPIDLEQCVLSIQQRRYYFYHRHYLNGILAQSKPWLNQKIHSIYEYDDLITGPIWGFKDAQEYYRKCSSKNFIDKIRCEAHLLFAEDDPFVSMEPLEGISIPKNVHVWVTPQGSHMGFLGQTAKTKDYQWMDSLLLEWVEGHFEF